MQHRHRQTSHHTAYRLSAIITKRMPDEITWYPAKDFRRRKESGLTITYTSSKRATLSGTLGEVFEGQRILIGAMADGRIVFRIAGELERGFLVRNRQFADRPLADAGLESPVRVSFEFKDGVFIETNRQQHHHKRHSS